MISQLPSPWRHVRGFERLSLCDWPGYTSSVLFLGGCNLKCPTCHNADLAFRPECLPPASRSGVMSYLKSHRRWLDGIVVTGGEPTMCRDLPFLLRELKEHLQLPIKVDTNGMRPDTVALLLREKLADTFFVDVKGPYRKYPVLSGNAVTPEKARERLGHIFSMAMAEPDAFVFRLTKVPYLSEADIFQAEAYLPGGFELKLQDYKDPRRTTNAQTDPETRRVPRDVVAGTHRDGHTESVESMRRQGSDSSQAACA